MHQRRRHSGKLSSYLRCGVLQDKGAWHDEGLFWKVGNIGAKILGDWGYIKALNDLVGHIVRRGKMNGMNKVWPEDFLLSEVVVRMACRTSKVDV
jgi:hypothetical protein